MSFQLMNSGPHDAVPRQRVEEAALALNVARARRLNDPAATEELLTGPLAQIGARVRDLCGEAREVVSVQQRMFPLERFRTTHEDNLRVVGAGVRMESLFDTRNISPAVLEFIATAELPYHCCYGPVQMKILDGSRVLLDGPLRDQRPTVLVTADASVLIAARAYVQRVRATAMLAVDYLDRQRVGTGQPTSRRLLTGRQRLVAELLDAGATDAEVAHSLGISVRTVRSEVARILEVLHARSRFGAGRRYASFIDAPP